MGEPFPYINDFDESPEDGFFISTASLCKKSNRDICNKYYSTLKHSQGFAICPHGFSSYVHTNEENKHIIYTALRISGKYNKRALKNKLKLNDFVPVITESHFFDILKKFEPISDKGLENANREFVNQTIHEIRKVNAEIKSQSEEAKKYYSKNELNHVEERIDSIFAMSSLISARLNFFDLESNPQMIFANKNQMNVYKKFDKVRYFLMSAANKKRIRINFEGQSYAMLDGYEIFELLPFLLLDNALKYSLLDQEISVHFKKDDDKTLKIIVSSIGPTVRKGEIEKIVAREYRGENAKKHTSAGTGIGLYFAKQICDIHGIELLIDSDHSRINTVNNIPYSEFNLELKIPCHY